MKIIPPDILKIPVTAGLLVLVLASPAAATDWLLSGSVRTDVLTFREVPPSLRLAGVEDGASNLDAWFDTRAYYKDWEASARIRIHQTSDIPGEEAIEEIDRRHVAFVQPDLSVWVGNYYATFGNGIILRTLEQRFVTLNRVDRAFNLDRNLDGIRLRGEAGPVRGTILSGTPQRQEVSGVGGTEDIATDDLLQGGEGIVAAGEHLDLALAYVRADLAGFSDTRKVEDLVSYRAIGKLEDFRAEFEYAERRPRNSLAPDGYVRYLRLEGAAGKFGLSVEGKSYRNFLFDYSQPPTLVRTHESVLLNRSTHVLLPDDEQGVQAELVFFPGAFTALLLNVSGSDDGDQSREREAREVYLEGRGEAEGVGAARLGLDWARDRIKGVEEAWTMALEVEAFVDPGNSLVADLELQTKEFDFGISTKKITNQLLQLGYSRAGMWTVTLTGEHSNDRSLEKRDWFFAALDIRISQHHDVTLGYGSRPAGIVCSGGFCFNSPEFDGAEFRLLSRF